MNNKIAHISDVHIKFGTRFEEYQKVFERTLQDVQKEKPKHIVFTGDLFHTKINISPLALELAGGFLSNLSKIANVFIIIGNHDLNLANLSQGDSISPIIELLDNGFIIKKDCKELPRPKTGNGIYLFKESGFYDFDDIVYGVYSCIDNEILTLTKKESNKKYIALYHGSIFGCIGDNGYEIRGDNLIKKSVFSNFDIIMLGDIHQFQSFEIDGVERMAYASSLIQQNFGEELNNHGYLIWDLEKNTFKRKFILNDYGYSKLNISKGEIVEERLQDLKFSFNKKKTKVWVELEDDEENYSVEKLSQVQKFIKDRYGCENVVVDFKPIYKEKELNVDNIEEQSYNSENFEQLLTEFLEQNNYDNINDVIDLSKEVDKGIENIVNLINSGLKWELNSMEISNLFSLPLEPVLFDFDKLSGITGVFGKNGNGKSNLFKALVWVLYQKILGDGEVNRVVNMYTGSNKGWGKLFITIGGKKFKIYREINIRTKKDGTQDVSYKIKYEYLETIKDEIGNYKSVWKDAESEEAATEKKEVKKIIVDSLGTFDDFTKVCLQSQGGKDDYLSLKQQPKNDLINRFLGLDIFRDRFDFANETFKKIKAVQKSLGDPIVIEQSIVDEKSKIESGSKELSVLTKDKNDNLSKIEALNKGILELTKTLTKIDNLEEKDENVVLIKIQTEEKTIQETELKIPEIEDFLSKNFKKELPSDDKKLDKNQIERNIKAEDDNLKKEDSEFSVLEPLVVSNFKKEIPKIENTDSLDKIKIEKEIVIEKDLFTKEKENYVKIDNWLKSNPKKQELSTSETEKEVDLIKNELPDLNNKLKISRGEKCPTCGHIKHEANIEEEKKLVEDISNKEKMLLENNSFIKNQKDAVIHNNNFEKENNKLEALKNSLQTKKLNIDELKKKLDIAVSYSEIVSHNEKYDKDKNKLETLRASIQNRKTSIEQLRQNLELSIKVVEIITHNEIIDFKSKSLKELMDKIDFGKKNIDDLKNQLLLLEKNKKSIEENKLINEKIEAKNDNIKDYKITNLQLDDKIKELSGNIRVMENNVQNYTEKLNSIKESDRIYKKYSVYLQAVDRDGIPAKIIKKKLPVVNYRINNILKGMVSFKIEMYVDSNGDIKEMFFFSDTKNDSLPLTMASGAQRFIGSVAIRDALHFVSCLTKPSLCIIDEGFGTLDEEMTADINNLFNYLKNKYKNILIITHKNEIKDFVDNVIQVTKTTKGLSKEQVEDNPKAGISQFSIG